MSTSNQFIIRTEDIKPESILDLFVGTDRDLALVAALQAPSPLIIEGSRGTGKSFLLRVCERQQLLSFASDRVLPVYVSFAKSSLLHAKNPEQFQHWMLARICSRINRVLQGTGLLEVALPALRLLSGNHLFRPTGNSRLEEVAKAYEASFRSPGIDVDDEGVPEVEDLKDAIEDICDELHLTRINLLFDEAAQFPTRAATAVFHAIPRFAVTLRDL